MNRRAFLKAVPAYSLLAAGARSFAQDAAVAADPSADLKPLELLKPEKDGGKSVLAALWERKTNRSISPKELPPQTLSNLLWAAWGINREAGTTGRIGRTAASASNSQEIDLYVVMAGGVYLYEAAGHRLTPVVAGDHRAEVGRRGRGGAGQMPPVRLVFVADLAKYANGRPQEPGLKDPAIQASYYNIATGLIAGNVYVFAASQGLAAWFHNCNKPGLAQLLKLRPEQKVLFAQTIGYPA